MTNSFSACVGLKLQTFAYFLLSVFLDAFLFDLTLSITRILLQFDANSMGYFCCKPFGGSYLVFHWSTA